MSSQHNDGHLLMKVLVYGSITVLAVVLVVIGLFALWYAKFIRDVTRNR